MIGPSLKLTCSCPVCQHRGFSLIKIGPNGEELAHIKEIFVLHIGANHDPKDGHFTMQCSACKHVYAQPYSELFNQAKRLDSGIILQHTEDIYNFVISEELNGIVLRKGDLEFHCPACGVSHLKRDGLKKGRPFYCGNCNIPIADDHAHLLAHPGSKINWR